MGMAKSNEKNAIHSASGWTAYDPISGFAQVSKWIAQQIARQGASEEKTGSTGKAQCAKLQAKLDFPPDQPLAPIFSLRSLRLNHPENKWDGCSRLLTCNLCALCGQSSSLAALPHQDLRSSIKLLDSRSAPFSRSNG
jgi:hypothetical protein